MCDAYVVMRMSLETTTVCMIERGDKSTHPEGIRKLHRPTTSHCTLTYILTIACTFDVKEQIAPSPAQGKPRARFPLLWSSSLTFLHISVETYTHTHTETPPKPPTTPHHANHTKGLQPPHMTRFNRTAPLHMRSNSRCRCPATPQMHVCLTYPDQPHLFTCNLTSTSDTTYFAQSCHTISRRTTPRICCLQTKRRYYSIASQCKKPSDGIEPSTFRLLSECSTD